MERGAAQGAAASVL
ncbi:Protein of unknown function [Thermobacillus xylanilyticus]|uniref:Uncharacterized protein n=1 Tax=Thermobacillus xylanilyticus TaxID=76633 RepID=A0ABN7RRI2_THEXY|nr:Protein of unknown function [Thermobacillus xylanilyticus]